MRLGNVVNTVTCIVSCWLAGQAGAISVADESSVASWLQRELEDSTKPLVAPGLQLEYERRLLPRLADEEFDALRGQVGSNKAHPRWSEMRAETLMRSPQGMVTIVTAWIERPGEFRFSESDPAGVNVDYVRTSTHAWRMMPKTLTIGPADANEATPDEARIGNIASVFYPELRTQMSGYLQLAADRGLVISSLQREGSRWVAMLSTPPESSSPKTDVRCEIEWNEDANRGFIIENKLLRSEGQPAFEGEKWKFEGWKHDPTWNRWVAGKSTYFASNGKAQRSFVWKGSRPSSSSFETLTDVPAADAVDPLRGSVRFTSILDFRANRVSTIDPQSREARSQDMPSDMVQQGSSSMWRWLGWVSLLGCTATVIYLRSRRS